MMSMNVFVKILLCLISIMLVGARSAHASTTWPDQPVTIIAATGPGSTHDVMARMIAKKLSVLWNQPVTVINRPGASGVIGMRALTQSKPDGNTIGIISTLLVGTLATKKNVSYNRKDFVGITQLASLHVIAVANKKSPFDSLDQLLAYARLNSGKVSYSSSGIGSSAHIMMSYVEASTGVKFLHVPYQTNAAATMDMMTGRIDIAFGPFLPGQIDLADTKIITTFGDLVTLSGISIQSASDTVPGAKNRSFFGVVVPKGTPGNRVDQLHRDITKVLSGTESQKFLEDIWMTPAPSASPKEFDLFIDTELSNLEKMIKKSNLKFD